MKPLTWMCDEHGCQTLRPTIAGAEGFVWVQARRPYCDRGHWEWGEQGIMVDHYAHKPPSYYFMHRHNAISEAEEWLARAAGAQSTTATIDTLPIGMAFAHGQGRVHGWHWERVDDKTLRARAGTEEQSLSLLLVQKSAVGGPTFTLSVEEGMAHDSADRFPRTYFDLARAMVETEAFLAWRLLKHPTEVPGRIEDPPRAVGQMLQSTQTQPARRPKR